MSLATRLTLLCAAAFSFCHRPRKFFRPGKRSEAPLKNPPNPPQPLPRKNPPSPTTPSKSPGNPFPTKPRSAACSSRTKRTSRSPPLLHLLHPLRRQRSFQRPIPSSITAVPAQPLSGCTWAPSVPSASPPSTPVSLRPLPTSSKTIPTACSTKPISSSSIPSAPASATLSANPRTRISGALTRTHVRSPILSSPTSAATIAGTLQISHRRKLWHVPQRRPLQRPAKSLQPLPQRNGDDLLRLDLGTISFYPGIDLSYILYLPSYAATAWYHKVLTDRPDNLNAFLDDVRKFAYGEYSDALLKGSTLTDAEKSAVAKKTRPLHRPQRRLSR